MKNKLLSVILFFLIFIGYSQEKDIDSTAIFILDKMSDIIGDLESVSFNMESSIDQFDSTNNIETLYSQSNVKMVGPDKLLAITNGDRGNHGFWYNGSYLSYYSYDENNYVTLEAPDNILVMIDSMHMAYDFKFPAADFFYPSFTDDIMQQFDTVKYAGKRMVDGQECFYITGNNTDTSVQLWVSNDSYILPKKIVIIYKNEGNRRYEATFTNWELNPNIPVSIFEFIPSPNSKLISIMSKS